VMIDITRNSTNPQRRAVDSDMRHNRKLAARLKNLPTKKPIAVIGFAQNVEHYMAWPISLSETGPALSARRCSSICP